MIWLRTLILVALWAAVALLAQWLMGDPAGWVLFSAALVTMLLWRSWRLHLVSHWARHPDTSPPASVGPWDDILAPLYRYTRARARELTETRDTMQGMLAAAQALPDGAVTLNEDFQIDWCNRMARQHLGLRLPADRGHNLLNLLRAPEFVEYAHRASWPDPILVRLGQNGQERLMMMQLTAYASNQRLLITRDVTQIERLETTRRDFVANVSHELRTPLTNIKSYAETIVDTGDELPPELRANFMNVIISEADRMTRIVQDLLTLSKIDYGKMEMNISRFPFLKAVQNVYDAAKLNAEQNHHHTMTLTCEGEIPDVNGDRERIEQVITNIVSNAVKYTPDGGKIDMLVGTSGKNVFVRVTDNGIGIPEKDLPRLFDRFYRVDKARSRESGGTGLGLSIAQEILNQHKGRIEISSEYGKGTSVLITMPAAEAQA